jgi:hypothetical protein
MAIKVYVAASYSRDRLRAKDFIRQVIAAGLQVTHDWTDEMPPGPEGDAVAITRRQAQEDLEGAFSCNVLVLLASTPMRGAWIELGAALAADACVIVVGDPGHCIFLELEGVTKVNTEAEALDLLARMQAKLNEQLVAALSGQL